MKAFHAAAPLATFTLAFLVVYAPIETWYSMPALFDPFYLVDVIGLILLAVGVVDVRRHPETSRLAVMIAGYAWTASNMWRALFGRVQEIAEGRELDYGLAELCFCGCVMLGAMIGLVWSIDLATRQRVPRSECVS